MQVRELRDRVADLVVDRALGDLAAVHVGHGQRERQRRQGRGEHLEPVAEHEHEIGGQAGPGAREAGDAAPDRRPDGRRRVVRLVHLHPLIDRPAVGLDRAHGVAELGHEVHAADHQPQREALGVANRLEHGQEMAVVGPAHRNDGDRARFHRSWGPRNGPQTPIARTRPGEAVARLGVGPQTPIARTRLGGAVARLGVVHRMCHRGRLGASASS